jgi:hypothetical protein
LKVMGKCRKKELVEYLWSAEMKLCLVIWKALFF